MGNELPHEIVKALEKYKKWGSPDMVLNAVNGALKYNQIQRELADVIIVDHCLSDAEKVLLRRIIRLEAQLHELIADLDAEDEAEAEENSEDEAEENSDTTDAEGEADLDAEADSEGESI